MRRLIAAYDREQKRQPYWGYILEGRGAMVERERMKEGERWGAVLVVVGWLGGRNRMVDKEPGRKRTSPVIVGG